MSAAASTNFPYAEVIGDPVAHSKSPLIHKFWLSKLGKNGDYRATQIRAEKLAGFFAERRGDPAWAGCNVTIPHKVQIMSHLDRIEGIASAVGAVNSVTRSADGGLVGRNTDVEGFLEPLRDLNDDIAAIHVIGAGGAARAVGAAFKGRRLTFFNRNVARAQMLADEFSQSGGSAMPLTALTEASIGHEQGRCIIVNASALGMSGQDGLEIDLDAYLGDTIVYDLVYAPLETNLLKQARRRGMHAIDGLHMLVGQAAIAFAFFFGVTAPREHDAELRAVLTS
ncbi:shikimate dehydrogenase [Sphingosinicella rhizophila]|uniref:Shikimate dehydrogenase (NADP(+)) n=1 Tax=Sphingosinicella rhizophila TaxID=3050082 RepID=A0ABU3Q803_9SPHN|nr:shikimate dehydrogenase [Sphingosinicella sp. GR2756]MDT9599550.1 shikimate dehydrogenase [Sphingosinicella sp. GR2756]